METKRNDAKNMKKIEKDENGLKWSTKITSNN